MCRCLKSFAFVVGISSLVIGCGGGGGGHDSDTDDSADLIPVKDEVSRWKISAQVSRDDCGERLAPVHQTVTVQSNGDVLTVDTTIVTVGALATGDGFTFGFEDRNGDCLRRYNTQFSRVTDTTADVNIQVATQCDNISCQDEWAGTAIKVD